MSGVGIASGNCQDVRVSGRRVGRVNRENRRRLDDHHVRHGNHDFNIGQIATHTGKQCRERDPNGHGETIRHQKDTSTPIVGSNGLIETPFRTVLSVR